MFGLRNNKIIFWYEACDLFHILVLLEDVALTERRIQLKAGQGRKNIQQGNHQFSISFKGKI